MWRPTRGRVGMAMLLVTESFFFASFVMAYIYYIGRSASGPQPKDVLELGPVVGNTIALLASSITIIPAVRAVARGSRGAVLAWLGATIALGAYFVVGTGLEWQKLMEEHGLFLGTNLFGTTFYSLIGFHCFHVIVGLILLSGIWLFSGCGLLKPRDGERVELVSWYWHFVDGVWIVVFTTVYLVGR
ncbi:MAG: heme-copper oxidase subunit III [Phycisphaerales bacterium]|nr:heme-copper oxidase subunit III [Phycisphaerales bacterium]